VICRLTFVFLFSFAVVAVGQTHHQSSAAPKPPADTQLYRNATFGFRYEIPFGWVDRTNDMRSQQADNKPKAKDANDNAAQGEILLAVFERPPDAAGETVNSAVVIAAEAAATYPGLKRAEDYLGPLTELTNAKGFKAEGDPSVVEIDGHELVRADFSKPLNTKLTMRQTTLVLLAKHQIVSFTFIAGTEDEVDDLIDGLHFTIGR
jgi:hypothetical protein